MNPKEPACFVMLGIASLQKGKYNLAEAAFERAIKLGSPQSESLQARVAALREYITESHKAMWPIYGLISLVPLAILLYLVSKIRDWRRKGRWAT